MVEGRKDTRRGTNRLQGVADPLDAGGQVFETGEQTKDRLEERPQAQNRERRGEASEERGKKMTIEMTEETKAEILEILSGIHQCTIEERNGAYMVVFSRVEKGGLAYDEYGPFAARAAANLKLNELLIGFLTSGAEEKAKKGSAK
jgi:hypothetical protein